ncbi:MAG: hypothetical protein ABIH46_03985, partial [Chloroflexota bacterium]
PPEIVEDPKPEEIAKWAEVINADDAAIMAPAVAAQVDYLVTGDQHFLDNPGVAERSGLRIATAAELVGILGAMVGSTHTE